MKKIIFAFLIVLASCSPKTLAVKKPAKEPVKRPQIIAFYVLASFFIVKQYQEAK